MSYRTGLNWSSRSNPLGNLSVRPATFLESVGTKMMVGLMIAIVLATLALLVCWIAKRPDAAALAGDLRLFPTSQPSGLRPEDVVELLAKRQSA